MHDDGNRLSFSISNDGDFSIWDNLTGDMTVYKKGSFVSSKISMGVIRVHVQALQEALMTYQPKRKLKMKKAPQSYDDTVLIVENRHYDWTVSCDSKTGHLVDNTFYQCLRFNANAVCKRVNHMLAQVMQAPEPRNPKYDIVRKVSEIGLFLWVWKGHSLVAYERNMSNCIMQNCLIDGTCYKAVWVSTDRASGSATLFTADHTILLTLPLDSSILTYYPDSEGLYEKLKGDYLYET